MPRRTIPLTAFTICEAEPGSSIDAVRDRPEADWLPAIVPGGVHEALLAAGRIPDPYVDGNERAVRWVEERDWWFRTQIPAASSSPGGRVLLVCQGLDTIADLMLDGQPLGHSENMFRPVTFDLTGRLETGADLLICFRQPLAGPTPHAPWRAARDRRKPSTTAGRRSVFTSSPFRKTRIRSTSATKSFPCCNPTRKKEVTMSDVASDFTATAALIEEEESLRLPAINELTCYEIGSAIAARAVEDNLPVTVAVYLGDRLVYKTALPGTTADNDVVIAGRRKVSGIGNHSSLYERNRHLEAGTTFEEATGSGFPECAPFGELSRCTPRTVDQSALSSCRV